MNRCVAVFMLCLLTVFLAREPLVSRFSAEMKPIRGVHVITNFPETTYPGSEIEAHYRFRNIAKKEVPVTVHFIITGLDIGMDEWVVTITIDEDEVDCHEAEAGFFESDEYFVASKSWHDLRIRVSLPADIPPSTYTLTMELYSMKVKVRARSTPTKSNVEVPPRLIVFCMVPIRLTPCQNFLKNKAFTKY